MKYIRFLNIHRERERTFSHLMPPSQHHQQHLFYATEHNVCCQDAGKHRLLRYYRVSHSLPNPAFL